MCAADACGVMASAPLAGADSGVEPIAAVVHTAADIERVVASLGGRPDTGLIMMPDVFTGTQQNLEPVISLAAGHRVPTIYPYQHMVAAGGLTSYGIDDIDLFRRATTYVDRILKGEKPADPPVQLPTGHRIAVPFFAMRESPQ
jgi:putative tryptophan/tyrosine transport system substrate-binding protein